MKLLLATLLFAISYAQTEKNWWKPSQRTEVALVDEVKRRNVERRRLNQVCIGDMYQWESSFGNCASYSQEFYDNYYYCSEDVGTTSGFYASQVCPQCQVCIAGSPSISPTEAADDCVTDVAATQATCTAECGDVTALASTEASGGDACPDYTCIAGDGDCPVPAFDGYDFVGIGFCADSDGFRLDLHYQSGSSMMNPSECAIICDEQSLCRGIGLHDTDESYCEIWVASGEGPIEGIDPAFQWWDGYSGTEIHRGDGAQNYRCYRKSPCNTLLTADNLAGEHVSLSNRGFCGPLPEIWNGMTALTYLSLRDNDLTGTLPDSWQSMTALTSLYLYGNDLTGTLPDSWQSMTALTNLKLWGNDLTGTLPDSWQSMTALTDLNLRGNDLTGTLPDSWQSMSNLNTFWIDNNYMNISEPEICNSVSDCRWSPQLTPDCNGVPSGGAVVDTCGVCDGDGSSCTNDYDEGYDRYEYERYDRYYYSDGPKDDCNGVPGGEAVVDLCGVCDGDGSSCTIYSDWFVMTGDCQVSENCVSSMNYPGNHENLESCLVTVLMDANVTAGEVWIVENSYDHVYVAGEDVENRNDVPPTLSQGDTIQWSSDTSITKGGWQLCFSVCSTCPTTSPTTSPTSSPSTSPTSSPTTSPSSSPTSSPTTSPTTSPSSSPTSLPTSCPTLSPTSKPTLKPTVFPTMVPTQSPTNNPSLDPTQSPTSDPTFGPTFNPSNDPSSHPTNYPSFSPSDDPSKHPTMSPTVNPTVNPSVNPTVNPSVNPSVNPTLQPTKSPSKSPSTYPTSPPTVVPSLEPSTSPSKFPTKSPSTSPTIDPTIHPTFHPSIHPTLNPTSNPSSDPTNCPDCGDGYFCDTNSCLQATMESKFDMTVDMTAAEVEEKKPELEKAIQNSGIRGSVSVAAKSSRRLLSPVVSTTVEVTVLTDDSGSESITQSLADSNFQATLSTEISAITGQTVSVTGLSNAPTTSEYTVETCVEQLCSGCKCSGWYDSETGVSAEYCASLAKERGFAHYAYQTQSRKCEVSREGEDAESNCADNPTSKGTDKWGVYRINMCPEDLVTTMEPTPEETEAPLECGDCIYSEVAEKFFKKCDGQGTADYTVLFYETSELCSSSSGGVAVSPSSIERITTAEDTSCEDNEVVKQCSGCECSGPVDVSRGVSLETCAATADGMGLSYFSYLPSGSRCEVPNMGEDEVERCVNQPNAKRDQDWGIYAIQPCPAENQGVCGACSYSDIVGKHYCRSEVEGDLSYAITFYGTMDLCNGAAGPVRRHLKNILRSNEPVATQILWEIYNLSQEELGE